MGSGLEEHVDSLPCCTGESESVGYEEWIVNSIATMKEIKATAIINILVLIDVTQPGRFGSFLTDGVIWLA